MSQYLLLKGYNTYQNRIVKKHYTLAEYETAVGSGNWALRQNVNFYYGNGIAAQLVYNYLATESVQDNVNYVVTADDLGTITGRYFVMECTKNRVGQLICDLKRDVVAEYYEAILDAPAFIEKATLQAADPMIFNSEGMAFNQIKDEEEILLKDATGTAWIVGYVAPKASSETDKFISGTYTHDVDFTTSNISSWNSSWINKDLLVLDSTYVINFIAEGDSALFYNNCWKYSLNTYYDTCSTQLYGRYEGVYKYREDGTAASMRSQLISAQPSGLRADIGNWIYYVTPGSMDGYITEETYNNYYATYNNKTVKDTSTGKLYRIKFVNHHRSDKITKTVDGSNSSSAVYADMQAMANTVFRAGHGTTDGFSLEYYQWTCSPYLVEVATSDLTICGTIKTTRKQLVDAPYCMFAIPYSPTSIRLANSTDIVSDTDSALAFARCISAIGGDYCYDVQLLPYCPRLGVWSSNRINLTDSNLIEGRDYTYYGSKASDSDTIETVMGVILWCSESEFNTGVAVTLSSGTTAIERKVKSETEMYRLSSPNYAASYEFNAAKNDGVTYIDIDCAYKPYNPYIHANPVFGGIYGADTNDTRGLVCQGDFSLPQSSEQWKQYELNNKNYQASFDRQIENMDVNHKYDRISNITSASVGAVQGAISGAMVGGIGGAIAGGVASAAGGVGDILIDEQKFKENKAYAKDEFKYQMDNIKARPNTLGKVSAYNPNNKLFLFIERYHATDEEVQALKNQMFYGGMTVGRIGTIREFIGNNSGYTPSGETYRNFVKGKVIRIEVSEDAHLVKEILNEIDDGVYIAPTGV